MTSPSSFSSAFPSSMSSSQPPAQHHAQKRQTTDDNRDVKRIRPLQPLSIEGVRSSLSEISDGTDEVCELHELSDRITILEENQGYIMQTLEDIKGLFLAFLSSSPQRVESHPTSMPGQPPATALYSQPASFQYPQALYDFRSWEWCTPALISKALSEEPKQQKTAQDQIFQITFPDGSIYNGPLKDGQPHGMGVKTFPNKLSYSGNFHEGAPHGRGVINYRNGNAFEGHFVYGSPHGEGCYTYSNGRKVRGTWANGALLPQNPANERT